MKVFSGDPVVVVDGATIHGDPVVVVDDFWSFFTALIWWL